MTEDYGPAAEVENVSRMCLRFATKTPIQLAWQVARTPESVQLIEAYPLVPATQIVNSCLATALCQWTGEGSSETCSAQITFKTIPAHFRNVHGIRKLKADAPICCWWEGCRKLGKRKYFVRHVREYLGHLRGKKHPSLERR